MKTTMKDLNDNQGSQLRERFIKGVKVAIASRGKSKGMLKKKCPPMNTDGAAVWNGIMVHANPYKVGYGHLLFMDSEISHLYHFTKTLVDRSGVDVRSLDRDRRVLEALNVW